MSWGIFKDFYDKRTKEKKQNKTKQADMKSPIIRWLDWNISMQQPTSHHSNGIRFTSRHQARIAFL